MLFVAMVFLMIVLSRCGGGDDCDEVRRTFGAASTEFQQCEQNRAAGGTARLGGGSYGGYSSGGGHK